MLVLLVLDEMQGEGTLNSIINASYLSPSSVRPAQIRLSRPVKSSRPTIGPLVGLRKSQLALVERCTWLDGKVVSAHPGSFVTILSHLISISHTRGYFWIVRDLDLVAGQHARIQRNADKALYVLYSF